MHTLPAALAPLAAYRQFIVYKLVPSKRRPGKLDKLPVDSQTGRVADAHDVTIWSTFEAAAQAAPVFGPDHGVGFVFSDETPFFFLDIDNCLLPNGEWSELAKFLCGAFQGAAMEISASGTGLHIFGTGTLPPHGCKNVPLGLELYNTGRFVALTGTGAVGSAATDCSAVLPWLVQNYFPPNATQDVDADLSDEPCEGWRGPADDNVLINRMLQSQGSAASVFGQRASFRDLWEGNAQVLAAAYPDPDRAYDASSADAALAQHLAFWTGKHGTRMQALMYRSALVRDKWTDRADYYLPLTIRNACARQVDVLQDKLPEPVAVPVASDEAPTPTLVTGNTYLSINDQMAHFKGCVYITDVGRVLSPGGVTLKPDQFKVVYGGYTFMLDHGNEKTTRDAWECFTQSQAFRAPRADSTCFKPDRAPAALVKEPGRIRANSWWPVDVPRKQGDAGPFLRHLAKVLPDERDRTILLSYMAACVQHQGKKFQWAPLLQGVEGNGKTFFTRCVAEAVGKRYTHMPPAHEITEKFNSWLFGTVFIGVEDIYVPEQKREIIEILKPMITGEELAKRAMQTDQVMHDVVCNFIFNSNHRNAVRKTRNDRRFCVLYCAQQAAADLVAWHMTGDYFRNLYAWAKADGYAIITEYLYTYQIPDEFNPAGACQRAPTTTSTEAAIEESMGSIEQEVLEAIEQGHQGFAGGWISSTYLDRLLERLNATRRVPINKRRELLQSLGYDWHPGLDKGRVNNVVVPDGNKPRLFIRVGHEASYLTGGAVIAAAYSNAQMGIDIAVNRV